MEDEEKRDKSIRGRGRASEERYKNSGRRPADELPESVQPKEKIRRESLTDQDRALGGPSGSRPPVPPKEPNQRRRNFLEIVNTRPSNVQTKRGESGDRISVQANYFRLLKKPTWSLYQYHVDFVPDIELTQVRKGVLSEKKSLLGGYLFDGKGLFTPTKLPNELTEINTKMKDGNAVQINIKFVGTVSMKESRSLQILNLIMRRCMEGLNLQLVGRNFYDAVAKIDVREFGLQMWPGYATSIRQHEKDIMLCCEVAHKVMRTDSLHDILQKCIRESRDYQELFKRQVTGMTVLTDYNNKTYCINDVDFSSNPKKTFDTKDGPISFIDYYYKKYNKRIRDPGQPLLISKAKERQLRSGENELIVLIPELCLATGLSESMRSNNQLMQSLSRHTRISPEQRIERLRLFNRRLTQSDSSAKVLQEWNMSLDPNIVEFQARVLKSSNIVFGAGRKIPVDNADWTRNLKDNSLYTCVEVKRMYVICPNRIMREANEFLRCLTDAARGMRMSIQQPKMQPIHDDRNNSYVSAIESCARYDPQIIMCVVPNNNNERYGCIKKKTCLDRAIPTQVICQKTITPRGGNFRGLMSIATKVAIQINCKLGAAAWMIELPLSGLMTIGFDLCRSNRDRSKSFSALVATMDLKANTRFYSTVSSHRTDDELSNELIVNVTKALKEYRNLHGTLPNRILFYRDGVGDGQIHQVLEHEVNTLKAKLKAIYKSANVESGPRFAFVIVSKRVNTRIFENSRNPRPGTVVDDIVTLPERYDFYLVSQSVRQGTVSPTSYNVIYDSMGLDPDRMQILTYKMTHLYYNWSGTTRVPAVCQYAHKLSTLVAQNLHQSPSHILEKQLYFL